MSFITLSHLNKQYKKGQNIIHDISLAIEAGEFLVIVGPSGCGKSTLLRMVAGLERVTGGTIHIDGRDVTGEEPGERDIAMVFQNYALYPHMTVYDNMAYGLRNRGMAEDEIKTRVDSAATSLQLAENLPRRPNQLSGGQRQRVAMGRAIVRSPKVFLFDEPLSNLDAKLRTQMRVEIKRIQRELATTSIYVTHDQVEAMTLADRLIVLNGGHIEQMGPPKALYEKPDTLFVAGFLGSPSMNFLPASSIVRGFEQVGDKVIYGIRPEHLLVQGEGENSAVQLKARVTAIEHLGSDALVYAQVANGSGGEVSDLIIRTAADISAEVGDDVYLGANADQVHLFDQDSGRRLVAG